MVAGTSESIGGPRSPAGAISTITLTRCKGCLGMVQITFLNPNTKTRHSCSSPADTSTVGSTSTSTKPSSRLPPSGAGKCRAKRAKPGQDMGPYSALRPLDEALPGELDHEGWASEEDKDYRGYPPRLGCRSVGGRGLVHGGKERSRVTEDLPSGGGIGEHLQVNRERWDFAVAQGRRSPPKEEPTVAGSSPSPTGLVFVLSARGGAVRCGAERRRDLRILRNNQSWELCRF